MSLDVIGAGLGRTGTLSLKHALEQLLGAPCYHMIELLRHPEHVEIWERALDGATVDWDELFADYRATVDWTAAAFLPELIDAYPGALVVLSLRDVDEWWRSVRDTVFEALLSVPVPIDAQGREAPAPARRFTVRMLTTKFTPNWADEAAAKAAFAHHNAAVRSAVPPDQLVEWRPGDGWEPLCKGLGLPVPAEPFPRVNAVTDFRSKFDLDPAQ